MGDGGINWTVTALQGARIIDLVLMRFGLYDDGRALSAEDRALVDEAMRFVAAAARVAGQPVTLSTRVRLRQRGLLTVEDCAALDRERP